MLLSVLFSKPVNAADWVYTMRPGDTLWTLCREYTNEPLCWQKLGLINNIAKDRSIPPGTRIRVPVAWLKVPPATVTVSYVQGEASFQRPDEAEKNLEAGMELSVGTRIRTGKGSLTLAFADGSRLLLEPDSELELDALSNFELNGMVDSTLRLKRGTVKTRVIKREPRSRFQTLTPSAVAAVRGTEYRVSLSSPAGQDNTNAHSAVTRIEVYDGLVDVGADAVSYPVPAKYGIVAKPGEALKPPVELLESPVFLPVTEQQMVIRNEQGAALSDVIITWQPLVGALAYQFTVFMDANSETDRDKLLLTRQLDATQFNLNELDNGCYRLSVRAIDHYGLHGFASEQRVCLIPGLNIPSLSLTQSSSQPENIQTAAQDVINKPRIVSWTPIQDAEQYRVERSRFEDFSELFDRREISDTQLVFDDQDPGLFIRVQAFTHDGRYSEPSPAVFIPVEPLPVEEPWWPMLIPVGLFILAIL